MANSMTKSELQAQVIELQTELKRMTYLKDAAQAERNDRESECQQLFESLQREKARYATQAEQLAETRQAMRDARKALETHIEALAEAKAELHSLSAAYVIQAEALHNANVKIESDAIGYFDDLRQQAEAKTRIAELARENMAQRARIHDLECLESAADETMQMLEAALVEERDANEALYSQVADLQTSVNLASAVTIKLKERLTEATMLKERAEAENVYYQGIAQNERAAGRYWMTLANEWEKAARAIADLGRANLHPEGMAIRIFNYKVGLLIHEVTNANL